MRSSSSTLIAATVLLFACRSGSAPEGGEPTSEVAAPSPDTPADDSVKAPVAAEPEAMAAPSKVGAPGHHSLIGLSRETKLAQLEARFGAAVSSRPVGPSKAAQMRGYISLPNDYGMVAPLLSVRVSDPEAGLDSVEVLGLSHDRGKHGAEDPFLDELEGKAPQAVIELLGQPRAWTPDPVLEPQYYDAKQPPKAGWDAAYRISWVFEHEGHSTRLTVVFGREHKAQSVIMEWDRPTWELGAFIETNLGRDIPAEKADYTRLETFEGRPVAPADWDWVEVKKTEGEVDIMIRYFRVELDDVTLSKAVNEHIEDAATGPELEARAGAIGLIGVDCEPEVVGQFLVSYVCSSEVDLRDEEQLKEEMMNELTGGGSAKKSFVSKRWSHNLLITKGGVVPLSLGSLLSRGGLTEIERFVLTAIRLRLMGEGEDAQSIDRRLGARSSYADLGFDEALWFIDPYSIAILPRDPDCGPSERGCLSGELPYERLHGWLKEPALVDALRTLQDMEE